jgi:hypothetical protein
MDDVKPDADDAIDDVKPDADDAMDDVKWWCYGWC